MASATLIRPKTYLAHGQIFQQGKPVPVTAEVAEALKGTGRFYIDEETVQPTRKTVVIRKTKAEAVDTTSTEAVAEKLIEVTGGKAKEPDEGVAFE